MNNKYECQNCRNDYEIKYYFAAPFCSESCENVYLDYAPIKLVNKVYEDYLAFLDNHKKETEGEYPDIDKGDVADELTALQSMCYDNINVIQCESCLEEIDYGYIHSKVKFFCSSACVEEFAKNDEDSFNHIEIIN